MDGYLGIEPWTEHRHYRKKGIYRPEIRHKQTITLFQIISSILLWPFKRLGRLLKKRS